MIKKILHHVNVDGFFLLMVIIFVFFLIARNTGLYPVVLADEYGYNKLSRLLPLADATQPDYLFFLIYKTTSLCGDGFLGCARLLNVLFFILASPFIYFIGRRLTGKKTAIFITFISICSPINTYTAYFMPESLYYLSFWVLTWLVLSIKRESSILYWFFMGAALGVSSLIKPHALFLLPGLVVYLLIIREQLVSQKDDVSIYLKYFIFVIMAIASKIVIGFMLAGNSGITFFGITYTSIASWAVAGAAGHYINLIELVFHNFQGHVFSLCLLFSVPVCQLLSVSRYFFGYEKRLHGSINTELYISIILSILLIVVACFTASIAGGGPYENNARLHMRYYNFSFPLLLLVVASQLSGNVISTSIKFRAIIGVPIGAIICYVIYTKLVPYSPGIADSPELRGFTFNSSVFYVLSIISLFSLVLWVYSVRYGVMIFLYLFIPLSVCFSSFYTSSEVRQRMSPDVYDKAGVFTRQYLSNKGMSNEDIITKVAVVGPDTAGLYRVLFHIDDSKISMDKSTSSMLVIPDSRAYDLSRIPENKEWILLIGEGFQFSNSYCQLKMDGFSLVKKLTSKNVKTNGCSNII